MAFAQFDLSLDKSLTSAGPFNPGDIVTYQITIANEGNLDGENIVIQDITPVGLVYQGLTDDSNVVDNGDGSFTFLNVPTTGSGVSMELSYQIDPAHSGGTIVNLAEIISDNGDDIDSDPSLGIDIDENGDGDTIDDDEDQVSISVVMITQDFYDLALSLDLTSVGPYQPGDIISFEILVDNQGTIDGNNIVIQDEAPSGLIFQDLTDDPNVTDNGGGTFTIGNITSGSGVIMELTYMIDPNFAGGIISHNAEIISDDGDDIDSDPTTDDTVDENGDGSGIDDDEASFTFEIEAPVVQLASLGSLVWEDLNGNGVQDPNEPGVEGIQVLLNASNGVTVSSVFTDANGTYLFSDLAPGAYYLEFILPLEYSITLPNVQNNDTSDSDVDNSNGYGTTPTTQLSPGENDLSWAAGIHKCVSIGQLVWFDLNENNTWDSTENGVNGMRVNLHRQMANGQYILWDYTYTDANPNSPSDDGYYKFCAAPGTYYLEFLEPPLGLVSAQANIGSETNDSDVTGSNGPGTTDSFTVLSGDEQCDIGAGYYPMGTIGDFVFVDSNQNGLRESNESGLANVYVQAFNQQGNLMGEAVTNGDGSYMIDYLQQTDVYLKFYPPTGYSATLANMGPESIDSDIDNSNGPMTTPYYDIRSGEHRANVDAGLIFGVVPVSWTAFSGENRKNHNWLQWNLAMEFNVSTYEIERSINTISNFQSIGKVASIGDSNTETSYSFEDYDLLEMGVYYYRIKQFDLNGEYSYSKTISIQVGERIVRPSKVRIYPNPSVGKFSVGVEVFEKDQNINYLIYDSNGKLAVAQTLLSNGVDHGEHVFFIDETQLTQGVYTILLNIGSQSVKKNLIIIK